MLIFHVKIDKNAQKLPKYGKNVKIQVFSQFWAPPGGQVSLRKKIQKLFCTHLGLF